jgi:hypothetical protein
MYMYKKYYIILVLLNINLKAVIGSSLTEYLLDTGAQRREFRHWCIYELIKCKNANKDDYVNCYLEAVGAQIVINDIQENKLKQGSKHGVWNSTYEDIAGEALENQEKYIEEFNKQKKEHQEKILKNFKKIN